MLAVETRRVVHGPAVGVPGPEADRVAGVEFERLPVGADCGVLPVADIREPDFLALVPAVQIISAEFRRAFAERCIQIGAGVEIKRILQPEPAGTVGIGVISILAVIGMGRADAAVIELERRERTCRRTTEKERNQPFFHFPSLIHDFHSDSCFNIDSLVWKANAELRGMNLFR